MDETQRIYVELHYIEDRLKDWHISWAETKKLLIYQQTLKEKLQELK